VHRSAPPTSVWTGVHFSWSICAMSSFLWGRPRVNWPACPSQSWKAGMDDRDPGAGVDAPAGNRTGSGARPPARRDGSCRGGHRLIPAGVEGGASERVQDLAVGPVCTECGTRSMSVQPGVVTPQCSVRTGMGCVRRVPCFVRPERRWWTWRARAVSGGPSSGGSSPARTARGGARGGRAGGIRAPRGAGGP
jgi:hypothetical protein